MSLSHTLPRGKEVAQPLLWLLVILAVGLLLRAWHLTDPVQVDEFVAVAAVAERQGVPIGQTATANDPLVTVSGLDEVSRRSVIPYGIPDPHPLYHNLLYGVLQVLPVADWSVRVPSLLAGLACIVVVFFLVRGLLGTEVALLAAALVALDPIQVTVSWQARPFALANLACLLSFACLAGLLQTSRTAIGAVCAVGYGLSVAFVGYLSPVMLLVLTAHVAIVGYALIKGREGAAWRAGLTAAGLALAVGLMAPEMGYWSSLFAWGREHASYLLQLQPIRLQTLFWHNLSLLGGLLLIVVAGAVVRWQVQGEGEAPAPESPSEPVAPGGTAIATAPTAAASALKTAPALEADEGEPLPENEEAVWMGRLWVFVPQLFALMLAYTTVQSIYQTRYLSYTTLGAAVLLAYFATRDRSREVRLGVSAVLCLAFLVLGFFPDWSTGQGGMTSNATAREMVELFQTTLTPREGATTPWKEGDVVLVRSGLPEADFLHSEVPAENRAAVERAILAPVSTLYADGLRRPVLPLSLSHFRNEQNKTQAGDFFDPKSYYTEEFAARVRGYQRYWVTGLAPGFRYNSRVYLSCLAPWLADTTGKELVLARNRSDAERYLLIPPGIPSKADIEGLTQNARASDFEKFAHIIRPKLPTDKVSPKLEEKEASGTK